MMEGLLHKRLIAEPTTANGKCAVGREMIGHRSGRNMSSLLTLDWHLDKVFRISGYHCHRLFPLLPQPRNTKNPKSGVCADKKSLADRRQREKRKERRTKGEKSGQKKKTVD